MDAEEKQQQIVDAVSQVIGNYLDDVGDWANVDTDDLAENIVLHLKNRGAL